MRRHPAVFPLAAVAASLVVAGAAAAQAPSAPGGAPASREMRREDWAARRQAHEAREAADLSTVLRLRPDQQTGLRAWLDAGRPPQGEREHRMAGMDAAGASAPTTTQTLDREAARMSERDTRMRAHMDATRRFYASLGPDQQAAFDALERLRHGHERHGGWGGRGMGPHGMKMGWRDPEGGAPPPRAGD